MARRGLQPVGNIVAEVIALRGIGRPRASDARVRAWAEAVGQPMAEMTRCGSIRRGRLEVIVANSVTMQELAYQKTEILARLNDAMPELKLRDLRFRVGPVA